MSKMYGTKDDVIAHTLDDMQKFLNGKYKKKLDNVIENIVRYAYAAGQAEHSDDYDRGVEDAWECACKAYKNGFEIFGCEADDVFGCYYGHQAMEVFKAYEEAQTVKVGDEVIDPNGLKAVVTNTDTHIHLLYENGKTWKAPKSTVLQKTGARFKREMWVREDNPFGDLMF